MKKMEKKRMKEKKKERRGSILYYIILYVFILYIRFFNLFLYFFISTGDKIAMQRHLCVFLAHSYALCGKDIHSLVLQVQETTHIQY